MNRYAQALDDSSESLLAQLFPMERFLLAWIWRLIGSFRNADKNEIENSRSILLDYLKLFGIILEDVIVRQPNITLLKDAHDVIQHLILELTHWTTLEKADIANFHEQDYIYQNIRKYQRGIDKHRQQSGQPILLPFRFPFSSPWISLKGIHTDLKSTYYTNANRCFSVEGTRYQYTSRKTYSDAYKYMFRVADYPLKIDQQLQLVDTQRIKLGIPILVPHGFMWHGSEYSCKYALSVSDGNKSAKNLPSYNNMLYMYVSPKIFMAKYNLPFRVNSYPLRFRVLYNYCSVFKPIIDEMNEKNDPLLALVDAIHAYRLTENEALSFKYRRYTQSLTRILTQIDNLPSFFDEESENFRAWLDSQIIKWSDHNEFDIDLSRSIFDQFFLQLKKYIISRRLPRQDCLGMRAEFGVTGFLSNDSFLSKYQRINPSRVILTNPHSSRAIPHSIITYYFL